MATDIIRNSESSSAPSTSSRNALDARLQKIFAPEATTLGEVSVPFSPQEEMPEWIGRYKPRQRIGRGGFGDVYAADDPQNLQRKVAVKIPRASFLANERLIERFLREVKAVVSLEHPNILPLLEAGRDGMVPYMVSPLCPGPDLARWLAQQKEKYLPVELALQWVEQLTKAVDHAHRRGFIHRDIKPSNILLDSQDHPEDPFGWVPKLTDFGLVKALNEDEEEGLTLTGDALGTPEYMSPEQLVGDHRNIGVATDIYSLGVVMHELLLGCLPAGNVNRADVLNLILKNPPPYPHSRYASLPADLRAILEKCLNKLPEQRYSSARELLEDLKRFRLGLPTKVRPLTRLGRLIRWGRQHPVVCSLMGAIVGLVMLLLYAVIRYESILLDQLEELKNDKKQILESNRELAIRNHAARLNTISTYYNEAKIDLALSKLGKLYLERDPDLPQALLKEKIWDRPVVFLPGHQENIGWMQASPNEKWLTTLSGEGLVNRWDLHSGVSASLMKKNEYVRGFVPARLSYQQAFLTTSREICLWDSSQSHHEFYRHLLQGVWKPNREHQILAYSPECAAAVLTDPELGIGYLALETGKFQLAPWPLAMEPARSYQSYISPNGRWLVIECPGHSYHLWSLPRLEYLGPIIDRYDGDSVIVSFDSEHDSVYFGFTTGTVMEADLPSRSIRRNWPNLLIHRQHEHSRTIATVPVIDDPEQHLWYVGQVNGEVTEIDLRTGRRRVLVAHQSPVCFLIRGEDGELLSADKNTFYRFDIHTGMIKESLPIPEELREKNGLNYLTQAVYLHQSQKLVLTGQDGRIAIWNLRYEPKPEMTHGGQAVFSVAFSPDSKLMASGGGNRSIVLWDTRTRKKLKTLQGHYNLVEALAFSPDGQWLFSGSYDKKVMLWSVATGKCERVYQGAVSSVRALAVTGDGQYVIAGCKKKSNSDSTSQIVIWKWDDSNPVRIINAHQDHVRALALSSDNRVLYSGSEDRFIRAWDLATGKQLAEVADHQQVWQLQVREDLLVSAGMANHISIWNTRTWEQINRIADSDKKHRGLGLSPDGRIIVTAGEKSPIRLWQAQTSMELARFPLDHDSVLNLAVAPNGNFVAAGCESGKVLLLSTE